MVKLNFLVPEAILQVSGKLLRSPPGGAEYNGRPLVPGQKIPDRQIPQYNAPGGIGDIAPVRIPDDPLSFSPGRKDILLNLFQHRIRGCGGKGCYQGAAFFPLAGGNNLPDTQVTVPETFPPFAYAFRSIYFLYIFLYNLYILQVGG